jgi:mono/diheme cytochrome c family protein
MIKKAIFSFFILFIGSTGCDHRRDHPGWDYFPDMFYSEAYETYTPNPNFEDDKTMLQPVEGTVPQGMIPFEYTIDEEDRIRAGEELVNPYDGQVAVMERGKELYRVFCSNCHGDKGAGEGYLYTSGRYLVLPRSLVGETARNLKDGEIYHSITVGYGSMGPHGAMIRPDDRWKIVSYIREVLQPKALEEEMSQQN